MKYLIVSILFVVVSGFVASSCIQDAYMMRNKAKGMYETKCMDELSKKDFWESYDNNPEYAKRINKMCGEPERPNDM